MSNTRDKILKFYEKYMLAMGIAGHFIFIFQAYKVFVHKSAADVSLEGFLIAFVSIISWLLYGSLKKDKVLIRVNVFGVLAASLCIIIVLLFK